MRLNPAICLVFSSLTLSWTSLSHADSIGLNFSSGQDDTTGGTVPDTAGVVPRADWNNLAGSTGDTANLIDSDGLATGASVTWASNNTWSVAPEQQTGGDSGLMNGYLDTTDTSTTTITVEGVPYAEYDVIVYMDGDGTDRSGRYTVQGSSAAVVKDPLLDTSNWDGTFVEAAGNGDTGNYSRWTGVSGATLVVTAQASNAGGGGFRAPINAVQIISTLTPGAPSVTTSPPRDISAATAIISAELEDPGSSSATVKIFWGTSDGGTDAGAWENVESFGPLSSPQTVEATLAGLQAATFYHYRAHAENDAGASWAVAGETFTTLAQPPAVLNLPSDPLESTSALLGARVTDSGGEAPSVVIHYGTTDGGEDEESWEHRLDLGLVEGEAAAAVSGLLPSVTYYHRARAMNSGGTAWASSTESFVTPEVVLPVVENRPPGHVSATTATLRGEVLETGGEAPSVTLHLGTTDGGTDPGSWESAVAVGVQDGPFSRFIRGLSEETGYWFRLSATNSAGTSWAPQSSSFETTAAVTDQIVINEIHYDPDDKTSPEEFVELHNPGAGTVDLSGWTFDDGISFDFPAGTTIEPSGYLVVAQDPARLQTLFGIDALGPFSGRLNNDGEEIDLRNAAGDLVDSVDYGAGFPWPTGARGGGSSMELLHPSLDNDLGGSWRASGTVASPDAPSVFVAAGAADWHYRKGTSNPPPDWTSTTFVEGADWLSGQTPIGYGDGDDQTIVDDMSGNYWSLYFRKSFVVSPDALPGSLVLRVYVDDGAIVWLNGVEVGRFHVSDGPKQFDDAAENHEAVWEELLLPNAAHLNGGTNVVAVHALNSSFDSSDFSFDLELRTPDASEAGGVPTPGAPNASWTINAPPQIRQVDHEPVQPRSNDGVVVTAKITDPDGMGPVSLEYQVVEPGNYIRRGDPGYEDGWSSVTMRDDGTEADATADDSIYTCLLPADVQVHRRLVRYRIGFEDGLGNRETVPYADDEQPNFAYFVYDDFPAWSGALEPGATPVQTFSSELLGSLPAYHLLARESDVVASQYDGGSNGVHMSGTLVYDGEVYDHIEFENRGEASTYVSGKNKWRFHFNRARPFQARDNWGRDYGTPWNVMNVDACVAPWAAVHRGSAAIEEAASYRLYELAGVPSPRTHFFHFRIVDAAEEISPADQYEGDLWGLYLAVEHPDGSFLNDRDLPDGNVYKIEGGGGDKKNQGESQPRDSSDWNSFSGASTSGQTLQWWQDNFDLPAYYSFRACNRISGNVDLREGWNHYFYHHPDGYWTPIPWDLDMMFIAETHWSGTIQQKACLSNSTIGIAFRNRCRELLDLMCSDAGPNGGQIGQLLQEYADLVNPPGQERTWADLDAALWNHHPRTEGSNGSHGGQTNHRGNFFYTPFTDSRIGGNWTRTLASSDHEGLLRFFVDYATDTFSGASWQPGNGNQQGYGYEYLALEADDDAIPETPSITYVGAEDFAANEIRFQSGAFSDPQGAASFAGMKWRVAEIAAPGLAGYVPGEPYQYEVEAAWESEILTTFTDEIAVPALAVRPGRMYRARVAHGDSSGRWSHWSAPIEFVVGTPDVTPWQQDLMITEIMYHPPDPSVDEALVSDDADDFEFIELRNVGSQTLDLQDLRFTKGIDFDFAGGTVLSLAPGAYVLVVKNLAAFEARYGSGLPVAGVYSGNLSNGGELIKLSLGAGVAVHEFSYDDAEPWPAEADGAGVSLSLLLPEERPDHALAENWAAGAMASPGEATDPTVERFDVSTVVNGEGSLIITPDSTGYLGGSVIQVTAVPAEGWAFATWEGPWEGQGNPHSITVNGDVTVTATFVPREYALSLSVTQGSGQVSLQPSKDAYAFGENVILEAIPDLGWRFAGWNGDLTGSANPTSLLIDADKTVGALFVAQYELTILPSEGGAISADPDLPRYDSGTDVAVAATPEDGYEFVAWSGDASGAAPSANVTMDADKTVGASFRKQRTDYETWLLTFYEEEDLENEAVSDPLSDPDGDGSPNLFEYFHRTRPDERTSHHVPEILAIDGEPASVGLRYRTAIEVDEALEATVEVSQDLETWMTVTVDELTTEPIDEELQWTRLMIPRGDAPGASYLRLRLVLNR